MAILAVSGALAVAQAVPTQKEVDNARGECRAHKLRVQSLEQNSPDNIAAISKARDAWQQSCTRASEMMDQLEGKPAPQPTVEILPPQRAPER